MSYYALYQDNANVVGHHDDRDEAVRQAVTIAAGRPDLAPLVGVVEVSDETGAAVGPFRSASQLLADGDPVATAVLAEHGALPGPLRNSAFLSFSEALGAAAAGAIAGEAAPTPFDSHEYVLADTVSVAEVRLAFDTAFLELESRLALDAPHEGDDG